MKIVSLFCGAGGLDLGLIQAGNAVVWANDLDPDAVATYKKNIGDHVVCADIKDIALADVPAADAVVGGFPCQGFSQANLRRTIDDDRNRLYRYFYQVVKEKRPKFFIAENVKGVLSLGGGAAIERIVSDFGEAGYASTVSLLNMADFGVPQTRQRVFIVGQRRDVGEGPLFQMPAKTHGRRGDPEPWVSIQEAIQHYPEPDSHHSVANHVCSAYKLSYRNFTGHRVTDPLKPSPTILARGDGKGGVCAIPHYNGKRRLTVRESAAVQTFPDTFEFIGRMNSCYRQIGNAVPVKFSLLLGKELVRLEGLTK
jgi:DNA (cytosine-5)-methyltransferase 1